MNVGSRIFTALAAVSPFLAFCLNFESNEATTTPERRLILFLCLMVSLLSVQLLRLHYRLERYRDVKDGVLH